MAFFGVILIPGNGDLKKRGTAPNRPDITYEFDEDTGTLKLSRDGVLFYVGQNQAGTFRDTRGRVFGHDVAGNIILNPEALPAVMSSMLSHAATDTETKEPKLCPATTPESIKGRSQQVLAYQTQVTQLPPGLDIKLINPKTGKPVSFDGCCTPANRYCYLPGDYLIEAKAEEYAKFMLNAEKWYEWFKGAKKIENQMERQNITAGAAGWKVIWHFAERSPAIYFEKYVEDNKLTNIKVFYTPAELP